MSICKPDPDSFSLLWPLHENSVAEDFLVYLNEPFMKHYAGTIFRLGAPSGISGWDDDSRVREKINFNDQRTYLLPDSGRGKPYTLPKNITRPLPQNFWKDSDICLGPWRITSMYFEQGDIKKFFDVLPLGQPPISMGTINEVLQNDLVVTSGDYHCIVQEMLTKTEVVNMNIQWEDCIFPCQNWPPGFYNFHLTNKEGGSWATTVIKMFPWYVASDLNHKILLDKTIW